MFAEISLIKKVINFLPVIPVYLVITTLFYGVTKYYILHHPLFSLGKLVFGTLFYICLIMVIITHTFCMITNPGYVENGWHSERSNNTNNYTLHCTKCRNDRPPRAHHCKVCRKCTLKMDHHCPWIANCVGFYNQKYFYQFLFYGTLGDFIGFLIIFSRVFNLTNFELKSMKKEDIETFSDFVYVYATPIVISVISLIAFAIFFSIGLLFIFHTKLIFNNQTTVETRIFSDPITSPWYYNNKYHNFKIVMGNTIFEWLIPKFKANIHNNGFSFFSPKDNQISIISGNSNNNTMRNASNNTMRSGNYMQLGELENSSNSRSQREGVTNIINDDTSRK